MDTRDHKKPTPDASTNWSSIVESWARSRTEEGNIRFLELERYSLNVVFGPCLKDVTLNVVFVPCHKDVALDKVNKMERVIETIDTAIVTWCEGFDAILLVFRTETTITQEDVSVLETLKAILGKNYLKHVIVLAVWPPFTGNQCRFDDWCRRQEGPFQKLLNACNDRIVLFNTFEVGELRQIENRNHLAKLVYALRSLHGPYTANYYKLFTSDRERLVIKLKKTMLTEKIKQAADILHAQIGEYFTQEREYVRACRRFEELLHESRDHRLLNDLIKIIQEVTEAEGNHHIVESNMDEGLLTKKIEDFVHRLEKTRRSPFAEFLNSNDATYLRNKIQELINIRNEMRSLRSTIDKYKRVGDTKWKEIGDAIRELRREITREDRSLGQLNDLMNIVVNLEERFRGYNKIPEKPERPTQTSEAYCDWDKIDIAVSVLGKIISAAVPSLSIPITVLNAAYFIGSNVMK